MSQGSGGTLLGDDSSSSSTAPSSSSSGGPPQLSPSVVVVIVIITIVFFLSGFLHLLARCLARRSDQRRQNAAGHSDSLSTFQGQLQQLFHLHDSGVEQAFVDTLPVFMYKSVRGLKEGADCAVCLNEFSGDDRLRLLPKCSHAFHIECIDTWLLSHCTCPLCRCSIAPDSSPSLTIRVESLERSSVTSGAGVGGGGSGAASFAADSVISATAAATIAAGGSDRFTIPEEQPIQELVPVKLGRLYPSTAGAGAGGGAGDASSTQLSRNLSRRSYSMGSFDYVLDSSAANEQVAAVALVHHPYHHPAATTWDQGSVCSTNAELKSTGSAASSTASIARRTLRWLLGKERTPRASTEDVFMQH